jgi:Xaa-Pro aminopeptidase
MNIYQKITKARIELQDIKLKKSGKNKYSNYDYYELGDLLPAINKLCEKYGITTRLNIIQDTKEQAILTLYNASEPTEKIDFIAPTAEARIGVKKDGTGGADPIQNLGGKITYMRRYMLVTAFEIAESDMVDRINREMTDQIASEDLEKIKQVKTVSELEKLYKALEKSYKSKVLLPHFKTQKEEIEQEQELDQTKGKK